MIRSRISRRLTNELIYAGRLNGRLLPGNEIESGEIEAKKRAGGKGNTRQGRSTRTRRRIVGGGEGIFARDSALEVTTAYPFTSSIFVCRSSERFTFRETLLRCRLSFATFQILLRSFLVDESLHDERTELRRSSVDFWGISGGQSFK